MHDLDLFDVARQETHGGSMRYYLCHKGKKRTTDRLNDLIDFEIKNKLDKQKHL